MQHFSRQQLSLLNRFRTDTAVPAEGNGNLQSLICVLVERHRRCLTLSNPVLWQNWMAAYLGYTLRIKTLVCGWPVMVHDTHTRRRRFHPNPCKSFSVILLTDKQTDRQTNAGKCIEEFNDLPLDFFPITGWATGPLGLFFIEVINQNMPPYHRTSEVQRLVQITVSAEFILHRNNNSIIINNH